MSSLSPEVEIWIPKDTPVGRDWTCKDWVCMFEVIVRSGVEFPYCPLMIELIQFLKVLPFQVMPLIWKTVTAVDAVCKRRGLTITLQDLMHVY